MSDPLKPLDDELQRLAASIAPDARRRLAGAVAADLRAANAKRIRANLSPDGARMEPRKTRAGRPERLGSRVRKPKSLKPPRMFQKAPAWLVKRASADAASVEFSGAADRIMAVHQFGLVDRVSPESGSPEVAYPERVVLGFSEADRERVMAKVLAQLAG